MIDLDKLIEGADDMPPLPATMVRLGKMLANEDWEARDVIEAVSLDQVVTMHILRMANSASLSRGTRISTLKEAIARLGAQMVLSAAGALAVKSNMEAAVPQLGLPKGELWRHSVAAALAAQCIADFCKARVPAEAFTAALLHDVGKVLLGGALDAQTRAVLVQAAEIGGRGGSELEMEVLGVDHAEVSGLIAQKWGLPEELRKAIQYHHSPGQVTDRLCDVVHTADIVAKNLVFAPGDSGHPGVRRASRWSVDPDVLARLEFVPGGMQALEEETTRRFAEMEKLYGRA